MATDPIDEVTQVRLAPIRPGRGWYGLGVALIAGGLLGAFAVLMVGAVGHLQALDELERFNPPGRATFVAEPGRYRVYHEPAGTRVATLGDLEITVRAGDDSGGEVPVDTVDQPDRYVFEGRRGIEVGRFEVLRAGTFTVEADGSDVSGSVAIGPGPTRQLTTVGFAALAMAAFGSIGGTVVLVVVRRRRARAREQRRLALLGRTGPPPSGGVSVP